MNTQLILFLFSSATVLRWVEKYFWDDWTFFMFMVLLVTADTLTGIAVAWKNHTVSSTKMQGLLIKIFSYGVTLFLIHALSSATTKSRPESFMADLVPHIDSMLYAFLVTREALSIDENLGKLGYNVLPKWIRKRMAAYDENGIAKTNESNVPSTPVQPTPITLINPIDNTPKV